MCLRTAGLVSPKCLTLQRKRQRSLFIFNEPPRSCCDGPHPRFWSLQPVSRGSFPVACLGNLTAAQHGEQRDSPSLGGSCFIICARRPSCRCATAAQPVPAFTVELDLVSKQRNAVFLTTVACLTGAVFMQIL